jgi:hypothetical protein
MLCLNLRAKLKHASPVYLLKMLMFTLANVSIITVRRLYFLYFIFSYRFCQLNPNNAAQITT